MHRHGLDGKPLDFSMLASSYALTVNGLFRRIPVWFVEKSDICIAGIDFT
jgi:hypothetical protein